MRVIKELKRKITIKVVLNKVLSLLLVFIPVKIFRLILEHRFLGLGVEITNICNANCTFCAYRFQKKKKSVITSENFKIIVDQYSLAGGGPMTFTPTVGDPLVDPRILEKIQYARSKKNITSILLYTNAILFHKFGFLNVLKSGISRIAISTYVGSREGYIKYYQKDKYQEVINNIIEITKLNKNLNNLCEITLHLRVEKDRAIWENTPEFKKIIENFPLENISYLTKYSTWSGKIDIDDLPAGCEIDTPIEINKKIQKGPCFELYRKMHVLPNLDVGACVCIDLENEINIGSLKKQSLSEIWHSSKIKKFRSNWTEGQLPEVCKNCTRYEPINDYIKKNKLGIFKEKIKEKIFN
jgi:radical SAM protein with 4Fe4S-binding SPASM domain